MQNPADVQLAAQALREALPPQFFRNSTSTTGLILGTGLSEVAKVLDNGNCGVRIPFSSLPNFPAAKVESHEGAFVFGLLRNTPVLAQLGRCHLYEGKSPAEVCMGVRVMRTLGIKTLIITNAAGALNPLFESGSLMCMSDIINLTGQSALRGDNVMDWGKRFPDMSQALAPQLQQLALQTALKLGIPLSHGVYLGVHGPELETPAETRMYRMLGADAIGMSTVLEIAAACHMGMRVLGFSSLTNKNLPDCMQAVTLDEILRNARKAGAQLERLLPELCEALEKTGSPR